ncbi:2Fe-2S iron-sulfur cluster-binding protein [Psychrobacter lutiphocae]|uniref:2Fe-2S iron-sulfur cluster-binding protein n=1 Tax=Psychrobacter lutiphocae TaxID=540500 RepID=UPI000373D358|nr:2Fe-2S iron-sulfur cluster-binding protein [Psychrobacter lutiphocae]
MSVFHPLKVVEVLPETEEAITLKFDIPQDLANQFKAKPGQHLKLKALIDDKEEERFYSICQMGKDFVRIGIKGVPEGVFSQYARKNIQVGDTLDIMAPQGDFCLPLDDHKAMQEARHYLFVAAGSGVTPVLSMMTYLLEETEHTSIDFIYINAKRKTVMFFDQIEALKNRYLDRLSVVHVLTREPRDLDLLSARPEGESFKQLLTSFVNLKMLDHTYLCGPMPIIEGFRSALMEKGIDKKNIHLELFGIPSSQTPRKVIKRDGTEKQVTVISGGREQIIDVPEGLNILDAAIEAGANVPFACKGGVCATCKAKLVSGSATMDVNYGLEDDEIDNGYILTCQAHIKTETAIVDFDI